MPRDRQKALARLLRGALPWPSTGRVYLLDPPEEFLLREALETVGLERLSVVDRRLEAQRRWLELFPGLDCRHGSRAEPSSGEFVVLPVGRQRQALHRDLADLSHRLGPEGRIVLFGMRKEGILPAQELLARKAVLLRVDHRAGGRLLIVQPPPPDTDWELEPLPESYTVSAGGLSARVAARPGVFSWDRLDPASALLLERAKPREGDRLLDLGCGHGALAALLLSSGLLDSATLTDSDALALDAARETLRLNGQEGQVLASDAGDELPDRSYELILCNPPYRSALGRRREPGRRMIQAAPRLLAPRGRIYLVGPLFHDHGPLLDEHFSRWQELPGDASFRIWRASSPRAPRPEERRNSRRA